MSPALNDVLATDADLDLVAQRRCRYDGSQDAVLAGLAALATAIDEHPLPDLVSERQAQRTTQPKAQRTTQPRPMARTRKGGFALGATVALVLSSSGIAAAVTGDALAPFHYVTKQVLELGPHGSGQFPGWDLDGGAPVDRVTYPRLVATAGQNGVGAGDMETVPRAGAGGVALAGTTSHTGRAWQQPGGQSHSGVNPPRHQTPSAPVHGRPPGTPGKPGGAGGGGTSTGPVTPSRPSSPGHEHGIHQGTASWLSSSSVSRPGTPQSLLPDSVDRSVAMTETAAPATGAAPVARDQPPVVSLAAPPADPAVPDGAAPSAPAG